MQKVHLFVDEGGLMGTPEFNTFGRIYAFWHTYCKVTPFPYLLEADYVGLFTKEAAEQIIRERIQKIVGMGWRGGFLRFHNEKLKRLPDGI